MYGLRDDTVVKLREIFSSFDQVHKVILFGSRAKGDYHEGSDIDFAIIGDGIDLSLLHRIELETDRLYLPYQVDLIDYQHIMNEDLKAHIERVGKLFFEKEQHQSKFRKSVNL